jgi:hypothetical protein
MVHLPYVPTKSNVEIPNAQCCFDVGIDTYNEYFLGKIYSPTKCLKFFWRLKNPTLIDRGLR